MKAVKSVRLRFSAKAWSGGYGTGTRLKDSPIQAVYLTSTGPYLEQSSTTGRLSCDIESSTTKSLCDSNLWSGVLVCNFGA